MSTVHVASTTRANVQLPHSDRPRCRLADDRLLLFRPFCNSQHNHFEYSQDAVTLLLLFSETLPFISVLIRPPATAISTRPTDWMFGLTGLIGPMLIAMAPLDPIAPSYVWYSLVIKECAFSCRQGMFGLSFGVVAANGGAKVAGPDRLAAPNVCRPHVEPCRRSAGNALNHEGDALSRRVCAEDHSDIP